MSKRAFSLASLQRLLGIRRRLLEECEKAVKVLFRGYSRGENARSDVEDVKKRCFRNREIINSHIEQINGIIRGMRLARTLRAAQVGIIPNLEEHVPLFVEPITGVRYNTQEIMLTAQDKLFRAWRIQKARLWYAIKPKSDTPTPFLEIRVYMYTREPDKPELNDPALLQALQSVQDRIEADIPFEGRRAGIRILGHVNTAKEVEEVDNDEVDKPEEQLWGYVAFYELKQGTPRIRGEYECGIRFKLGIWEAGPLHTGERARWMPTFIELEGKVHYE